jgi:MIP family channel proteins
MNIRAWVAEFLGTFLFFGIGLMSIQAVESMGDAKAPFLVVIPFAFGFGLLAAIFAFGHISGGHYNPAVTVAMAIDGRTTPTDAAGYIGGQLLGAIAASLLVLGFRSQAAVASTITRPGGGFTDIQALVLETVLTAGFVLVILTATRHASALAALAIPLTLVAIHMAAVPFSGASVNPARTIGPALVGGDLGTVWIYIVGPVVGGALAALIYRALSAGEEIGRGTQPRQGPGSRQAQDDADDELVARESLAEYARDGGLATTQFFEHRPGEVDAARSGKQVNSDRF